ncbi:hypothetical protein AB4P95_29965 (plasmid) [Pseudomonas sp. A1437]
MARHPGRAAVVAVPAVGTGQALASRLTVHQVARQVLANCGAMACQEV